MAKIIVTSDSTCAMPRDIASSIGLNILPLNVIVNGVEYHDGIDIDLNKLCLMMREGADIKTSTPTHMKLNHSLTAYLQRALIILFILQFHIVYHRCLIYLQIYAKKSMEIK